jgi:hypothetical protein
LDRGPRLGDKGRARSPSGPALRDPVDDPAADPLPVWSPKGRPGSILVTGGADYVGSHVALALLGAGWPVVVLDDLSRGRLRPMYRLC